MNRITEPTEEGLEVASAALTAAYGLRLEPLKAVKIRIGLSEATVYRRGDLLDKRRALMGDWAGYLAGRL